jgi:superfamily II DNA or RNA helicase
MGNKEINLNIGFDAADLQKQFEEELLQEFKRTAAQQIGRFFRTDRQYVPSAGGKALVTTKGAGVLLIEEFLQKKWDDPNTQERMQRYFDNNFDRIMEESMQKAIQHKTNAMAFAKTKERV